MKPLEDFFQTYYNDTRAIRRQATYRSDKANEFAVYIPTAAYTDGDILTTNAIYSLRPYTGDTEREELYSLAEQYKLHPCAISGLCRARIRKRRLVRISFHR